MTTVMGAVMYDANGRLAPRLVMELMVQAMTLSVLIIV